MPGRIPNLFKEDVAMEIGGIAFNWRRCAGRGDQFPVTIKVMGFTTTPRMMYINIYRCLDDGTSELMTLQIDGDDAIEQLMLLCGDTLRHDGPAVALG